MATVNIWFNNVFLHSQTTHLVVNNAEKSAESYKGRMAQKYGIPIVSTSFVDVSVESGELMEPDDFLLVGKTAAEQFQTGKIIGNVKLFKAFIRKHTYPYFSIFI